MEQQRGNVFGTQENAIDEFKQVLINKFHYFLQKIECINVHYTGDGFVFAIPFSSKTEAAAMQEFLWKYVKFLQELQNVNNEKNMNLTGTRLVLSFSETTCGRIAGPHSLHTDFHSRGYLQMARLDEKLRVAVKCVAPARWTCALHSNS